MTIPFSKLKAEWMKDPAFRAGHEKLKPEFALALAKVRSTVGASAAPTRRGRCEPRDR